MLWECNSCGHKTPKEINNCESCGIDRLVSMTMVVEKKRRMCEECGHIHREHVYCHVFTEAADNLDNNDDYISEDDGEEDTESNASDDISLGKAKVVEEDPQEKTKKRIKMKPLATPEFVKKINYIRCNCDIGVPSDSRRFESIPRNIYVGKIWVQSYDEIMIPSDRKRYLYALQDPFPEKAKARKQLKFNQDVSLIIPFILAFLPLGQCAPIPQVSTFWNTGTQLYQEYLDMRSCVPWQGYRIHQTQVDSILLSGSKVYTGGDKRVIVSDLNTAEILGTVTRDSGFISFLYEKDGKNLKLNVTLWDHTRSVSHLLPGLRSVGICAMHGIDNHICTMYTASEDRSIKLWNLQGMKTLRSIYSKKLNASSFTKIAISNRHLFAGTTNASIAVFTKYDLCERDDVHACSIRGSDKSYCMQLSLKLPPIRMNSGAATSVTGLLCTDSTYMRFAYLWATDNSGQLTIWYVPESGLLFKPAYTVKLHNGAINNIIKTNRHAITISDDGYVILINLFNFDKVRSINIVEWSSYVNIMQRIDIPRKIKCAYLQEYSERYDQQGMLIIGTSYGDVIALCLGTTI